MPHDIHIGGVLPVFQTPFNQDDSVDLGILERELRWIFDQGAAGVTMGMVSEVLRLNATEREEVIRITCEIAREYSAPAVISIGAESTRGAIENARTASSLGAAALMAIPPLSIAALESEIFQYYSAVIESVDIPVIVQDASGYVGRPLSIDIQARLFDQYPSSVYFKPEAFPIGPRVSELRDATNGGARIIEGTGGIALVDSYRRGIVGTMPGADLCWAIVALWQALEHGAEDRIYRISGPLASLISMQPTLDSFLAIQKYLLKSQGIFENTFVRGPVSFHLDDETAKEASRLIGRLKKAVEQTP